MKKILMIAMVVGFALSLTSCATSEQCWAYKSTNKYNNSKKRPSVAGAMNKERAKLAY